MSGLHPSLHSNDFLGVKPHAISQSKASADDPELDVGFQDEYESAQQEFDSSELVDRVLEEIPPDSDVNDQIVASQPLVIASEFIQDSSLMSSDMPVQHENAVLAALSAQFVPEEIDPEVGDPEVGDLEKIDLDSISFEASSLELSHLKNIDSQELDSQSLDSEEVNLTSVALQHDRLASIQLNNNAFETEDIHNTVLSEIKENALDTTEGATAIVGALPFRQGKLELGVDPMLQTQKSRPEADTTLQATTELALAEDDTVHQEMLARHQAMELKAKGADSQMLDAESPQNTEMLKGADISSLTDIPKTSDQAVQGIHQSNGTSTKTPLLMELSITKPVHEPAWADKLIEKVRWMVNAQHQKAEIRLDPPDLGPLKLDVSLKHDHAQVTMITHSSQVREILDQHLPKLREMLESQGFESVDAQTQDQQKETSSHAEHQDARQATVPVSEMDSDEIQPQTHLVVEKAGKGRVDCYI